MNRSMPPRDPYNVHVDPRLLLSPRISDEAARVGVALEVFFAQRDGRRGFSPTVAALEGALVWPKKRIIACLDELADLGILGPSIDEWDHIGQPVIGGRDMVEALGVGDIAPKAEKLDTRLFFCPDVLAEGARLWAIASLRRSDAVEILTTRLGWDGDDVESVARGLAELEVVTLTVGPGGTAIKAHRLPDGGLACVEFTSEELGKVGGARSSKTLDSLRRETEERKRRERSRST